ncbi:ABC transporter permease [Sunxiuqinia sp. A32]|uniref:ABC transporter permease n=1 Tax=Sunxiuqinia sp. A32 TaxID=3461496 RepID=UPI00404687C0
MITHHIKQSFRGLKKNKLFSFLNIGGFAVSFSVCMILALYTYKEFNVDKDYTSHSTIYRLIDTKTNSCRIDFEFAQKLKEQYSDIKLSIPLNYISFSGENVFIKTLDKTDYIKSKAMISTTNDFFKAFSVPIISGNPNAPFADLNSVVITKSAAIRLFGKTDVLGEIINFGDVFELPVSAVSEDLPANSSFDADVFYNGENEKFRFARSSYNGIKYNPVDIYVQLNDETDAARFATMVNKNIPPNKSRLESIGLQKLTDIYLTTGIEGNRNRTGSLGMIRIFLSIALLIMLLSVINYVNFSLSKQLSTLKEIGIKITNGAGTRQLRSYYLVDVSTSVLIAFILALVITKVLLPFADNLLGVSLDFNWLFSPVLMGLFLLILLTVILISSFAPVYIVSKFDVQRLFGMKQYAFGKQHGKKVLTVFQLSAAIALLIGLMVIQKQIHYVKSTDLGFDKEQLVRIDFRKDMINIDAMKQQIDQLPFVQNSTLSHGAPGSIYMTMSSDIHDKNNFDVETINVDEKFIETFDIQLLQGRKFEASDIGHACYINEATFKRFGWDNLENRKIDSGIDEGFKVIGIVNDFNVASLHTGMEPVCLIYRKKYTSVSVKLRQGNLAEQMKQLTAIWKGFVPENPMMYTFYDSFFDAFYKKEERQGKAIATFSIITFIITCLGLMGQIFQTTNARIKEIGIRKVNGAKVSEVMGMLNKDFVKSVMIAFIIAAPATFFAMNKWLENFAYKTSLSWWIFALAGTIAMGIALLTVSFQSWRAATRNPVEALRYE